MPIRVSSTKQIDSLVANLSARDAVAREAAIARLTVIGSRAVERLIALASDDDADAEARAAAWRTLDAIGDSRALVPALRALGSASTPPATAAAAALAARAFIKGPRGATVVDRLTAVVVDRSRPDVVRIAALRALRDLDRTTIAPLLASLADDPSVAVRSEASGDRKPGVRPDAATMLARAADEQLPTDPATLRAALHQAGAAVPIPALVRIVERVRQREGAEPPAQRDQWRLARAAAHQALADRGSRLALYDLRESLESAKGGLPVEFLAPLATIGDASCLEAIAAAHASANDAWLRQQLARALYAIVDRERLTQRSAVLRKLAKRLPARPG